jgi:hypothetical protein
MYPSGEKKIAELPTISLERNGKHFTGYYEVAHGAITVTHGIKTRTTRLGGTPVQVVARQVLFDMVGSNET